MNVCFCEGLRKWKAIKLARKPFVRPRPRYMTSPSGQQDLGAQHVHVSRTSTSATDSHDSHLLVDLNRSELTRMVDELFSRTRLLMDHGTIQHHVVAFSGGVDSSLAALLVNQCRVDGEEVRAILGVSPAVSAEQMELAEKVASHIGVVLNKVPTTEGSDEMYIANAGQACLACKTHLYSTLKAIVNHAHAENASVRLYNGTNKDDLADETRLGLIAADKYNVQSPLSSLSKRHVRTIARHLGLFNWNYAASPCLRSRLALGVEATAQHLRTIEEAERFVRKELATVIDESSNLRVRLLSGNRACIEVDPEIVKEAEQVQWEHYFINVLGFSSVQVRNFRSGSVARKENNAETQHSAGLFV